MSEQRESLSETEETDCAVCLQKLHHPTKLPCNHVFCFLCVKGVAIQNRKCAMCRAAIPPDYLDNPILLDDVTSSANLENEVPYQWLYEGRNGWWKYDERSNEELEAAFNAQESGCTLLLAGALYHIDFQSMIQKRRNDNSRRRKVRRDTPQHPAKGIAGIKITQSIDKEEDDDSLSLAQSPNNEALEVVAVEASDPDLEEEGVSDMLQSLAISENQNNLTEDDAA